MDNIVITSTVSEHGVCYSQNGFDNQTPICHSNSKNVQQLTPEIPLNAIAKFISSLQLKKFPSIRDFSHQFSYNNGINTIKEVKTMNPSIPDWTAHDNCTHTPNIETIKAMEEADEILERTKAGQARFTTLDEMFKELDI